MSADDRSDPLQIAMIGTRGMPAQYGGVETVVDVLARQLAARGHDVTVFCRSEDYDQHPPMVDGVRLVYLPAAASPGVGALVHAFRAVLHTVGRGYDVIHFHALGPGLMAIVARIFTRATVITTVHGRDDKRAKWGRLARIVLRVAAGVSARVPHQTLVVSESLAREYADEYGRRTTVVPNSTHAIGEVPPGETLERLGLRPGRYLVSVGRLVPEKAPHELIAAHRRTLTELPLVLIGGSAGTEDYVEHLDELVADDSRVLLTGPLYGDELAEVLTNAGAFVTASHLEGLPTALIEAGRAGLPLIASDIAPHREILDTDDGAPARHVYPIGNDEALAALIDDVSDHLDEEQLAAKRFAAELDDRYAPARTAEVHEAAYLEAIERRAGD